MEDYLDRINDVSEKQKTRFKQGLGADVAFLILIILLIFANWYTGAYATKESTNPVYVRIFLYIIMYFFLAWDVYAILKNSLGWYSINDIQSHISEMRRTKSSVMNVQTRFIFSGFLYDVLDKLFSEFSEPLEFHLIKKQENLKSLNIRYAIWDFFILSTGIAWFVGEIIYYKSASQPAFSSDGSWTTILGLVVMILCIIFVAGYLIPRQVIINKQIKLNNEKKLTEEQYYDKYKFFYVEKVLTKFWNRDNK